MLFFYGKNQSFCLLLFQLVVLLQMVVGQKGRLWKTFFLDELDAEDTCLKRMPIRNDDMSQDDYYLVNSDKNDGSKKPAECTISFNFGDRLASLLVTKWWCQQAIPIVFLAVYSDCEGRRNGFLAQFNCSSGSATSSTRVDSPTYCMTLYHYRGPNTNGFFFSVSVTAMQEMFSFPAGTIAAVIIGGLVLIMIVIKIICVVTGHDKKLPEVCFYDNEDRKKILLEVDVTAPEHKRMYHDCLEDSSHHACNQLYATHPPFRNLKTSSHKTFSPGFEHNPLAYQHCSRCNQHSPPASPASHIIKYSRSPRSSYGNNLSRTSHDNHSLNEFSDTDDFLDASLTASPS